jgi:hypothetical protein
MFISDASSGEKRNGNEPKILIKYKKGNNAAK